MKTYLNLLLFISVILAYGCQREHNENQQDSSLRNLLAKYESMIRWKDSSIVMLEKTIKSKDEFAVKAFENGYLLGGQDAMQNYLNGNSMYNPNQKNRRISEFAKWLGE